MICKIQVVIIGDDGREETRELACLERGDLKPETLGLTLAEGKMILKDLQHIVVERQVSSSLLPKRACPDCGQARHSKGNHALSVRTVFDQLTVRSPRLHHCTCRPHHTKTFSLLAELLPERISPELLFRPPSSNGTKSCASAPGDRQGVKSGAPGDRQRAKVKVPNRKGIAKTRLAPGHA